MKYGIFTVCGECKQPVKTFDICSALGYNPGVDGHLFDSPDKARSAWSLFVDLVQVRGPSKDYEHLRGLTRDTLNGMVAIFPVELHRMEVVVDHAAAYASQARSQDPTESGRE
jgi:hypothetical protein